MPWFEPTADLEPAKVSDFSVPSVMTGLRELLDLPLVRSANPRTLKESTIRAPSKQALNRRGETAFALLVAVLILLNLATLAMAVPETSTTDGGCCAPNQLLAKDFSAYYTAAWRLFHDPSQIYYHGALSNGAPIIVPEPEGYKYLPSLLLLVSPFLALPYNEALLAFDYIQFLLLPLIAALVYMLVRDKGTLVASGVAVAVLALPLPLPTPQWALSASYYWQWAEGQSKVLETFLLLFSLAMAKSARPRVAGVVFGVASFDPRFALLSLPLFLAYGSDLKKSAVYAASTILATNLVLLYPPTLVGFLTMLFTTGLDTSLYYYSFIPVVALVLLMVIDRERIGLAVRGLWERPDPTRSH
jgi:hypothetical protein